MNSGEYTHSKKYFAFISYKREDEKWAVWLQNKLEHYKLPSSLNGRTDLPKEIRPIFRDQSDLAGGVLADEINNALENSRYLIVICSPKAAQSEWVSKEVKTFIDLGRSDKIIPFIIGGTAHAQNPEEECYPVTLREMPAEQELLGININEMGRDAAAVKVVAQMFGLKFDELWQRFEREKKRNRRLGVIGIIAVVLFIVLVAISMWQQNIEIKRQNVEIQNKDKKMLDNRSRLIAEKAQFMVNQGDPYNAHRVLLAVLPDSLNDPNNPYTQAAGEALLYAIRNNNLPIKNHKDEVCSAFYSPDGTHILTASKDKRILIWEIESDSVRLVDSLVGHEKEVDFASYSPDGKFIVSGSEDGSVKIWDAVSHEEIPTKKKHDDALCSVVFSPDGKKIVSASKDKTAIVWDATNGNALCTLKGHTDWVYFASFSPDSKRVITASRDISIRLWDVETGDTIAIKKGKTIHARGVNSVIYSPDGEHIASTSSDGTIKIWNAKTLMLEDSLQDNNYRVYYASYSPDGKQIVSASDDDCVRIWDIEQRKLIRTLRGHVKGINTTAFSPDGSRVISASDDKTARIWYMDDCDTLSVSMDNIIQQCRRKYPPLDDGERISNRLD